METPSLCLVSRVLVKQEKLKSQRQWRTREEHVESPKLFTGNCNGLRQLKKIRIFHCKIWQEEQNKFVMSSPGKRSQDSFLPPHSPNYQTAEASPLLLAQGILVGDRASMAWFQKDMHGRTSTIIPWLEHIGFYVGNHEDLKSTICLLSYTHLSIARSLENEPPNCFLDLGF